MISKFVKKIFIVFTALLIGNISLVADANQLKSIQQKQKEAHEKVNKFKILENREKNKLYSNQQKLEQASNNLQYSKNQYSNLLFYFLIT